MIDGPEQGCPSIPARLNSAFRALCRARSPPIRPYGEPAITTALQTQRTTPRPARAPAPPRALQRPLWSAALPGALLALALGLWGVRREGHLWRDEAVTVDVAGRELPDLWDTLGNVDAVHGLYYLFMHGLFRTVPYGVDLTLVLRIPSVLATAVAAAGVALTGLRLAGPRTGLLAGLVFAVLPPVQRFAQEGRSYAMVCAAVVWATYLLVRAVQLGGRRRWAGYAAVLLLACLLHEFAVLALAAHALVVPRAARRSWLVAAATVVAGLTPLAVLSQRQSAQVEWIGGPGRTAAQALAVLAGIGVACAAFLARDSGWWGTVHRGGNQGRGRSRSSGQDTGGTTGIGEGGAFVRLGVGLAVLPSVLLLLASLVRPLYMDRYVLYSHAGLALLVGGALDRAARGARWRAVVAAGVAGAALVSLVPLSVRLRAPESRVDDTTAVARALRDTGRYGDAVLYLPLRRRAWSRPYPWAAAGLRDIALDRDPVAADNLYGTEVPADVLRARLLAQSRRSRVVVATDPHGPTDAAADTTAGEAVKRSVLDRHFEKCRTRNVDGARVILYARPGHC
ncbi:hypothetical protein [Streptomyces sp. NPDC059009]|uniref:hypothetical protein n=1 Tax=Streptomyces sp. NPDC059009 TaxID=3346694 RepID=UPI003689AD18